MLAFTNKVHAVLGGTNSTVYMQASNVEIVLQCCSLEHTWSTVIVFSSRKLHRHMFELLITRCMFQACVLQMNHDVVDHIVDGIAGERHGQVID